MVRCQVATQRMGWLVLFPDDPNAAWVLFDDAEKIAFANSCNVDLPNEDILYLDPAEITECPEHWYELGREWPLPF